MHQPDDFSLEVTELDGFKVVSLAGELDMMTVPALVSALAAARRSRVIVDLSGLEFMDSSGVRALIDAQTPALSDGGSLVLVVRPESVPGRVVELTGLAEVIPIAETLAAAFRELRQAEGEASLAERDLLEAEAELVRAERDASPGVAPGP